MFVPQIFFGSKRSKEAQQLIQIIGLEERMIEPKVSEEIKTFIAYFGLQRSDQACLRSLGEVLEFFDIETLWHSILLTVIDLDDAINDALALREFGETLDKRRLFDAISCRDKEIAVFLTPYGKQIE